MANLSEADVKRLSGEFSLQNVTRLTCVGRGLADASVLERCPSLFYCNLSQNKLVDASFVNSLPALQTLILDDNCVSSLAFLARCDEEGAALCRAESLSLERNRIADLGELRHLARLRNLKVLQLSGNPVCNSPGFLQEVLATCPGVLTVNHNRVRTSSGVLLDMNAFIEGLRTEKPEEVDVEPVPWLPDSAFELEPLPDFEAVCGPLERKLRDKIAEYQAAKAELEAQQ